MILNIILKNILFLKKIFYFQGIFYLHNYFKYILKLLILIFLLI